jgi:hypothetical protein
MHFVFHINNSKRVAMKIIRPIIAAASLLLSIVTPAHAGTIYNINFNGGTVDLSGFIETDALGTFSPTALDSMISNYSILASWNGANPFTFTKANSTWGEGFLGAGANVIISILGGAFQLSAPTGYDFNGGNLFLLADNPAPDGIIQNLRIAQDHLGFRSSPDTMVFETVSPTFTLGLARIPEPAPLPLMVSGLALIAVHLRRAARTSRHSLPA